MKTIRTYVAYILILVMFILTSCSPVRVIDEGGPALIDNQVLAIQARTAATGIANAMKEKAGTAIMVKDQAAVFLWGCKDYWCFAGLNGAKPIKEVSQIGGNLVNAKTMSDIKAWMESNGWRAASASEIPALVLTTFAASVQSMWPTFVIAPVGFPVPPASEVSDWN
jgi:hypothetical protein